MAITADTRKTGIYVPATLLAASAVAVPLTGTTNETALVTVSVPPPGPNGGIEVRTVWSVTNSVNNKSVRLRLGGLIGSQHMGIVVTSSASISDLRRIRNRNSSSSQVGMMNSATAFGSSTAGVTTSAVDWSVAQDLAITGQLALGTETITLESYEVWLLP